MKCKHFGFIISKFFLHIVETSLGLTTTGPLTLKSNHSVTLSGFNELEELSQKYITS